MRKIFSALKVVAKHISEAEKGLEELKEENPAEAGCSEVMKAVEQLDSLRKELTKNVTPIFRVLYDAVLATRPKEPKRGEYTIRYKNQIWTLAIHDHPRVNPPFMAFGCKNHTLTVWSHWGDKFYEMAWDICDIMVTDIANNLKLRSSSLLNGTTIPEELEEKIRNLVN